MTHMTRAGTIVPLTRKVTLSNDISTIFQFRALDWGMENCELRLDLPALSEDVLISGYTITLDVFRLNASDSIPLNENSLTYANRPARMSKLAEIDVSSKEGVHWRRHLSCTSESLLAFELACNSREELKDCSGEWWQNGKNNVMVPNDDHNSQGFYIIQHASA